MITFHYPVEKSSRSHRCAETPCQYNDQSREVRNRFRNNQQFSNSLYRIQMHACSLISKTQNIFIV